MSQAPPSTPALEPAERGAALWRMLAELVERQPADPVECMARLDAIAACDGVCEQPSPLADKAARRTGEKLVAWIKESTEPPTIRIQRLRVIAGVMWMPLRLLATATAARIAVNSGLTHLALELLYEQLALAKSEGERESVQDACINIASMKFNLDHTAEALRDLDLLLSDLTPDERRVAGVIYGNRAVYLKTLGRYAEAIDAASAAEKINREYGRSDLVCGTMLTRANVLIEIGELEGALQLLDELEQFARILGDHRIMPLVIGTRGSVCQDLNRFSEALSAFRRAEQAFADLDDSYNLVITCGNIAALLYRMGRIDEAEAELERASSKAIAAGMTDVCIDALCVLVDLVVDRGETVRARAIYDQLDRFAAKTDALTTRLLTQCVSGRLMIAEGRFREAIECLSDAVAGQAENQQHSSRLRALLAEARLGARQFKEAIDDAQAAHDCASSRVPPDAVATLRSCLVWAKAALASNDLEVVGTLALDMNDLCAKLRPESIEEVRLTREAQDFVRRRAD